MRTRNLVSWTCALLLFGGVLAGGWAQYTPQRVRTVLNLKKSWKFVKQNVSGAQATAYNDGSWSSVNLPHSFDIPYFRANAAVAPYVGWYRRHVTVDQASIDARKRFSLEFEGSFIVTTVYVNGDSVGQHRGGYTGFTYDITSRLHAGDNVIAARVDGSWQRTVAPRAGEHIFIGGIYRNVSMVVTEPLHVAWYGTFVTTPSVSTSAATVKVRTEVVNSAAASKNCTVKTTVVDSAGNQVTWGTSSALSVPAGAIDTFVQVLPAISSPRLWSPSTPYLYKVYTEIYDGPQLVDNYVSPLGIRSIAWSASQGFSMNGQRLWLHGANVHQDHAGWGDATANTGSERDVKLIKDCGMNFIRGSHYPHAPAFAAACDKYGVCFWSEMCFWATSPTGDTTKWAQDPYPSAAADQTAFNANVLMQLQEMIKIFRNDPSIVVWSMCNEVFFGSSTYDPQKKALLAQMVALSHAEDSTRPAAIGGCQRDGNGTPAYYKIGDVAGFNGDGASISTYQNSGVASLVSEYGSCYEDRPGNNTGCWGNVQTAGDTAIQQAWRSGISLWCAFHHGSNLGMGNMGMIDHARLPLERWYYYRQKNLGIAEPTWPASGTAAKLAIITDRDTITDDGKSDVQVIVQIQDASGKCLSNTTAITLTDNSGLGIFPSANAGGQSISFASSAAEQGVRVGECAIEYRAYNPGVATITASASALTGATKTIVINHVADQPIVYVNTGVLGRAMPAAPRVMRQVRFAGSSLMVPPVLHGRDFSVAIYSLQGRLLKELQVKRSMASSIKIKGLAESAMIARFTSR